MGSLDKTLSFTALDGKLPVKILKHEDVVDNILTDKVIPPIHIRVNITNRCNLRCPWCCRTDKVDRNLEMDWRAVVDVVRRYKKLGCKAVTISGGGEPLMHEQINSILFEIARMGIKIGILTNGWFIDKLTSSGILREITWIRVSLGDGRKPESWQYWDKLRVAVAHGPNVDWGFSYVVTNKPDFQLIKKMVRFANEHHFIHVRMVSDINVSNKSEDAMDRMRDWLQEKYIDDNLVIYQSRANWKPGRKMCRIGLLRPIIDTDGYIYACCATGEPDRDYVHKMAVGAIDDIEIITKEQKCVDGSVCKRCFMDHYNEFLGMLLACDGYEALLGVVLETLLAEVKHKEFI